MISTLLAVERRLNWLFAYQYQKHTNRNSFRPTKKLLPNNLPYNITLTLTMYSTRLWECLSITDSIQIRGFTCNEERQTWLTSRKQSPEMSKITTAKPINQSIDRSRGRSTEQQLIKQSTRWFHWQNTTHFDSREQKLIRKTRAIVRMSNELVLPWYWDGTTWVQTPRRAG